MSGKKKDKIVAVVTRAEWREGFHSKGLPATDAAKAYQALLAFHPEGPTADDMVDYGRKTTGRVHDYFEWDDGKAGPEYRKIQARDMLSALKIEIELPQAKGPPRKVTTRLTTAVPSADSKLWRYQPTLQVITSDEAVRERMLGQAKAELEAFRKKYADLTELCDLLRTIDEIVVKL